MYYYTRKEFENCVKIFTNSTDFRFTLLRENIFLTTKKINSLSETLLYNKDTLDEMTIDEIIKSNTLIDEKSGEILRTKISSDLGVKFMKEKSYRSVIFTFKYAAVKNFFYGQYRKFLPEYDFDQINASKKTKAFFDATMKELDRIDDAISRMASAVDIDEIPYRYLEYLASLIGYQNEDKNLVKDYVFRDLIKNMIEVYKIKGTNYSFELFLTFLGFDVVIKEYWFDRRFYYKKAEALNEYTKATKKDRDKYIFYLAPESPEKYIPTELTESFTVFKNEIKGTMDLNMFNRYLREGTYQIAQLLGFEPGFDNPYTYFKTNVVDFNFTSFKKESEQEISEDDIKIINKIFDFLLPIFIKKQYMITINDWEENVNPDPDLNDDWANSFFLFTDKYHTDKTIDISYEECKGFDPIYERTRRWDEDSVYNKGSIVIYDNSIDYEFYKEINFGDIIRYNEKYYIYIGSDQYMLWNPESDTDDYVPLPDEIPIWENGMTVENKDVVRYNFLCYVYMGQTKVSTKEPSEDNDFLEVGLISGDYPSYYKCTELLDAYSKYDYVLIGQSEDPETHEMVDSYAWSRVNYNTDDFDNLYDPENNLEGTWVEFGEKSIEGFTVSTYNLINGRIYRFPNNLEYGRLYVYEGILKPSYINPLNDPNFKLLTRKANNKEYPDESEIWEKIDFSTNSSDFSVLDRLILGEGLSEKTALEKIAKMFENVCITSEKFDKWPELKNKYIYLDFEGNENYENGAEAIEIAVDCTDWPVDDTRWGFTLQNNQVLKYQNNYLYCYNATTVSNASAIQNVINNNNSQYTALIENNWATTNYNPNFKMYVPVNYKTIKIEFTGDNPDFTSVCNDIETTLDSFNITGQNGKYVFERFDDYFRIYSKLDAEFNNEPYIKIQYDFLKDIDTVPYVDENGDTINSFYGVDPNNAYKIFPDYFTSPRYRYDFAGSGGSVEQENCFGMALAGGFSKQVFEFANRGNYITEFYPSTKFALKRILRREVFNPIFDKVHFEDMNYHLKDGFVEEKKFPTLDDNFSFKDNQQKCFEEYYKEKNYKDYPIVKINDKICVLASKAKSAFYPGERAFINIITSDNHSYFYNTTINTETRITDDNKVYYQLDFADVVDLTNFASGTLRKFDEKIYNIEEVNNGEIKISIIDNQDQPFIPKPTITDTVKTHKDLMEYNAQENDIVEVEFDGYYFNKPTLWKYENGQWHSVIYTSSIDVYIENSNETIQKECEILTSEVIDDPDNDDFDDYFNIITINHPEILNGFVSGKIILNKNIWRMEDYYRFINEYLLAGRTTYNWYGKNTMNSAQNNLLFNGSQKF